MAKRLNSLEKELLIKLYRGNPRVKLADFCRANNVSVPSMKKWMALYDEGGIEGLAKGDSIAGVLPEGIDRTEENYKREILKLRIENERLKKAYVVLKDEDGRTTFSRLSPRNSK